MSYGLPDDWFIEHTGERLILDQDKVAAEIERLDANNTELLTQALGVEAERDIARFEIERLRAFARWAVQEGPFNGCDLDGGDVQTKAIEFGIIVQTQYDPATHGEPDTGVDIEPGDPWFVFAYQQSTTPKEG